MSELGSRFPKFFRLSVAERLRAVHERGLINEADVAQLEAGRAALDVSAADQMIENVIGVMGLPIGLGLNFLINEKDYVVPLVVEEPSIVAALSAAAKLAREAGGFRASSTDPILTGQIQVVGIADMDKACRDLRQKREEILNLANSFHPNMVARGGGARELTLHRHELKNSGQSMLVVHLQVDTRDAMGANLINSMCEGVAPLIESITQGQVFLRILSNLTDQALARASVRIPTSLLAARGYSGEEVRDGIVLATDFATTDPYRAATHNKGVMNGIDPVAIATGNDWRAIEAGAHAYAARDGQYSSLTNWYSDQEGYLCGEIELPLKVGTVGAPLQSNPAVAVHLRMMGIESATELAEIMATVGLAQNFSALRALATEGIQRGHMTLHARSVLHAAGARTEFFEPALERLLTSGEIKVWKAEEILKDLEQHEGQAAPEQEQPAVEPSTGVGYGKVILVGEHSVVYGRHAIALPIPLTMRAHVTDADEDVTLLIPSWGVEYVLSKPPEQRQSLEKAAGAILDELKLAGQGMRIEVFPEVPRGVGLGSSSALAVAIVRALDAHFKLDLSDEEVNALAFRSETFAHGRSSGLDNTLATYAKPLVYRSHPDLMVETLNVPKALPLVVALSGKEGLTATTVGAVRRGWEAHPALYERIFDGLDQLALRAVETIQAYDLPQLGEIMNLAHGLLNGLRVSSPELERLVDVARRSGALGAKLTGGGGGGSIVALHEEPEQLAAELNKAGYVAFAVPMEIH